jgi:hypothetical protein
LLVPFPSDGVPCKIAIVPCFAIVGPNNDAIYIKDLIEKELVILAFGVIYEGCANGANFLVVNGYIGRFAAVRRLLHAFDFPVIGLTGGNHSEEWLNFL